jgi:hypothetical protein
MKKRWSVKSRPYVFVAVFAALGLGTLLLVRAATPTANIQPENGTKTGNVATVSDGNASGGQAIQFGSVTAPSSWPNASNVGLLVPTTRTFGGVTIDSTSWFTSNGFSGAGTQANPYLVDRVLFTSRVRLGNDDSSNLSGKWVKFTNCRFYGDPSTPTQGGSADLEAKYNAPFFIVEDSTLGHSAGTIPSGGTPTGTDKAIMSYVPFQAFRNNIYGAAIPVYFETERNETTGVLVQDNYIHDIWSSGLPPPNDDHTDVINGNFHASHVTIRHNYIDGIRSGNSYTVNCFGIYDDPPGSGGIIEDWTIDNNYIDRCTTLILSSTSSSRFLNPFVVTNNVFARSSGARFSMRTPSVQSGNVDQNGNPVTL